MNRLQSLEMKACAAIKTIAAHKAAAKASDITQAVAAGRGQLQNWQS